MLSIFGKMRSWLFIVFFVMNLALNAQNSFEQIAEQEMKSHQSGLKGLYSNAVNNTNIIYDRLEFFIDPAFTYITGKVSTIFIPDGSINFLEFDLTDTLGVDSVIYHGQKTSFTHFNNIVHINLPVSLTGGAIDSVVMFYQGMPDSSGFGSFARSSHDSVPIISTLSEPYGARDWWPCKQDLQDKIDSIDILITTPAAYKAASNGLLVEQITQGPNITYHWKHRYPIATYLVCLAVTNYRVFTNLVPFNGDTLPILNYVYPESYAADTEGAKQVVGMIQLYDSLFGMYPFSKEKYGQVQFNWGGGMEHQTMTFMHDYGFELTSHELGHHWFGDKVTCASWQDIWLNEGFAVFLTTLCYKHLNPTWYTASKKGCIQRAIQSPNGSVWCDDTTTVGRIFDSHLSYAKGSIVLHQLNWILGDSIFFMVLRNYLNDTVNAYKFGTTPRLQNHFEMASGIDLTNYFTQYVYGKGFPSFQVQWSQDFSHHVVLTIGQTQSDPSVSFFQIPVPIQFAGATADTLMVFTPLAAGQTYTFDLPFLADSIIFDPNFDILSGNNTVTRQVSAKLQCIVYPNPVSGVLQFQVQSAQGGNADIKIYNLQGQMVWGSAALLEAGSGIYNINIGQLPAGLYELKIILGQQHATVSFEVAGNR